MQARPVPIGRREHGEIAGIGVHAIVPRRQVPQQGVAHAVDLVVAAGEEPQPHHHGDHDDRQEDRGRDRGGRSRPDHDREWGVPVHDDRVLFEFITLEGAQAGLSWETILAKREAYRRAFAGFDPAKVALVIDHSSPSPLEGVTALHTMMRDFGIANPRIAVAGLNPHAGESGLMGDEEERIIAPAIEALKADKK